MNIKHEVVNFGGVDKIYLYIEMADEYEFGEEFLHPDENNGFLNKLKEYVTQKVEFKKEDMAVLIVNGILIGAISLAVFTNANNNKMIENATLANQQNYEVALDYVNKSDKDKAKQIELNKNNIILEENALKADEVVPVFVAPVVAAPVVAAPVKAATPAKKTVAAVAPKVVSGATVKLSTNGVVETMNLEDYVIGVVASEMPVTYQPEALKSQAIASRTFAVKKTSEGVILLNSNTQQT